MGKLNVILKLSVTLINQGVQKYESIVKYHSYTNKNSHFGNLGKLSNKFDKTLNVRVLFSCLTHANR